MRRCNGAGSGPLPHANFGCTAFWPISRARSVSRSSRPDISGVNSISAPLVRASLSEQNLSTEQIGDRIRIALVRHVQDVGAGIELQLDRRQLRFLGELFGGDLIHRSHRGHRHVRIEILPPRSRNFGELLQPPRPLGA